MIVCVDIGNSYIKMALVDAGRVRRARVIESRASSAELERTLRLLVRGRVTRGIIASVLPQRTETMRRALRRELGADPVVVGARTPLPIRMAVRHPERVGTDRVCAACGAVAGRLRHAIVVDAGSAITVDLVRDRRFMGGLIIPGPQMMLDALHEFTAQLPGLALAGEGIGRFDDTARAMRTGAVVGSAGAIEAGVRLLREASGVRPRVWVTGGHAARLSSRLPSEWVFVPHLTLLGLARIAAVSRPRR